MKNQIEIILRKAVLGLYKIGQADFSVDYPTVEKFGDYATNAAMVLAKELKKNPMEIAEAIKNAVADKRFDLEESKSGSEVEPRNAFEKVEVVAPGYLNFYLSPKYLQEKVAEINKEQERFGNSGIGKGIKINNEFISANPTGPLTVGNGRGGFCGDSLARVMRKAGFAVTNEYYVNDAGGQIEKLGHSVRKDAEAVYAGEYIEELHQKYAQMGDVQEIGQLAAKDILENIIKKSVAEKMQIAFDVWTSEKSIQEEKFVERAIEILQKKNLTYESEGAVWLKTTEFGDDKDRVLIKSDGQKAYFASDCGYMLNKIERGFDRLVMGLGADHHGYVSRLKALAQALGFQGDFRFIISQMVRIVKDGKEVRMSKRAGNVVEIDELIEKVGHDVARFFFLQYSPDAHMNFDLGLAQERSQKNPVFYVQYAHARICSIIRKAEEFPVGGSTSNPFLDPSRSNLELLTDEKELSLMKELNKFPELVEEIAESYEIHKLPHYAIRLADKFHSFYQELRVIDPEKPELSGARLNLVNAVRIVLAETLRLIGVNAPEKM